MTTYEVHVETRPERPAAARSATLSAAEIGTWLATSYAAIDEWLTARGIAPEGTAYARYREREDGFAVDAGFVVGAPIEPDGTVEAATLPGGTTAVTTHVGPYNEVGGAYEALVAWLAENGGEPAATAWEEYLDGPEVDPTVARTIVVMPYRPV